MNKDQVTGKVQEAVGKVKEVVGHTLGNEELELKGTTQKNEGKARVAVGELKEAAADEIEK